MPQIMRATIITPTLSHNNITVGKDLRDTHAQQLYEYATTLNLPVVLSKSIRILCLPCAKNHMSLPNNFAGLDKSHFYKKD